MVEGKSRLLEQWKPRKNGEGTFQVAFKRLLRNLVGEGYRKSKHAQVPSNSYNSFGGNSNVQHLQRSGDGRKDGDWVSIKGKSSSLGGKGSLGLDLEELIELQKVHKSTPTPLVSCMIVGTKASLDSPPKKTFV